MIIHSQAAIITRSMSQKPKAHVLNEALHWYKDFLQMLSQLLKAGFHAITSVNYKYKVYVLGWHMFYCLVWVDTPIVEELGIQR
jgi:hypothetical protein